MREQMQNIGKKAKAAAAILANADRKAKDFALLEAAKALRERMSEILAENSKDVAEAKAKGMEKAMVERLTIDEKKVESMAKGLEEIAELNDPVGKEISSWDRPNGLNISRVGVPLGVIGIIYESRPNVTADAGALCLKSGNAAILRGGSESFNSSRIIVECLHS
ncbi:MAG: glutamate-5-semialdehyde dehydrogenase [Rickettsiaceae bacterium]|nr:glutamate-5-semialdehyde dehydrogenase [Rickettsiaceae bacterium]